MKKIGICNQGIRWDPKMNVVKSKKIIRVNETRFARFCFHDFGFYKLLMQHGEPTT